MVDHIVKIVGAQLILPLFVTKPDHVNLDLLFRSHKRAFFLRGLLQVSLNIDSSFLELVAVYTAFDLSTDLCPDDERAQFCHLADFWPETGLKSVEVNLEAQILGS